MHRILVVDDDIDLLHMVKLFLQTKKFTVKAISKWEDIQSSISAFDPELILMDISLNGADGRVICQQLKMVKDTEDIPIVLFSGNYNVKGTIDAFPADGFLEKPFDPENLIEKIQTVLSGSKKISS